MAKRQAITAEQVRHVARLSRLRLSNAEVYRFTEQLADVLNYMAKLDELDLDQVEPLAAAIDLTNVLRADTETPGMTVEAALSNAPETWPPFFKVPKILGEDSGA